MFALWWPWFFLNSGVFFQCSNANTLQNDNLFFPWHLFKMNTILKKNFFTSYSDITISSISWFVWYRNPWYKFYQMKTKFNFIEIETMLFWEMYQVTHMFSSTLPRLIWIHSFCHQLFYFHVLLMLLLLICWPRLRHRCLGIIKKKAQLLQVHNYFYTKIYKHDTKDMKACNKKNNNYLT